MKKPSAASGYFMSRRKIDRTPEQPQKDTRSIPITHNCHHKGKVERALSGLMVNLPRINRTSRVDFFFADDGHIAKHPGVTRNQKSPVRFLAS